MSKNFEKEYKESIGRAKKILGNCDKPIDTNIKEAIEAIFPILKKDKPVISREVIREGVAHFGITQYQIDNWLKKHFDIIEQGQVNCNAGLEFHEGKWLCANKPNDYAHLVKIIKVVDVFGKERHKVSRDYDSDLDVVECDFIEKNYHPWTIADAREGDILASDVIESLPSPFVAIFKTKDSEDDFSSHCFIGHDGKFYKGEIGHASEYVHPATKEQRNALMKVMTEAGYTFNFETKELKEIEQKSYGRRKECLDCQFNYAGECEGSCQMKREEQKPVWSEEDEKMVNDIIAAIDTLYYHEMVNWLKSLKDRCKKL